MRTQSIFVGRRTPWFGTSPVLASTASGGCAGLFGRPVDPSSYAYARGQGQIVFQLPLAVVVEELDRSLTEAGSQVTFRHIDRQGAIVKAKTKDGKAVDALMSRAGAAAPSTGFAGADAAGGVIADFATVPDGADADDAGLLAGAGTTDAGVDGAGAGAVATVAGSSICFAGAAINSAPTITAAAAPPAHHMRRDGAAAGATDVMMLAAACSRPSIRRAIRSRVIRAFDCSRKLSSARRISSADWKRSSGDFDIARDTIDSISGSIRLTSVFIGAAGCWITLRITDEMLSLSGSNGRRPDSIS